MRCCRPASGNARRPCGCRAFPRLAPTFSAASGPAAVAPRSGRQAGCAQGVVIGHQRQLAACRSQVRAIMHPRGPGRRRPVPARCRATKSSSPRCPSSCPLFAVNTTSHAGDSASTARKIPASTPIHHHARRLTATMNCAASSPPVVAATHRVPPPHDNVRRLRRRALADGNQFCGRPAFHCRANRSPAHWTREQPARRRASGTAPRSAAQDRAARLW